MKFTDKNNISSIPSSEADKLVQDMITHAMSQKPMTDAERKADNDLKQAMGFGNNTTNPYA